MRRNLNIDENLIEQWDKAYTDGVLPDGYVFDGGIKCGRPKLFDDEMTTLTIRIPVSQKSALCEQAKNSKTTMSEYARHLITVGMM